ncbi:hypothetical protein N7492_006557 [Penicillium capsulatum]|uniref:Vacuolar ATPase assembly integral membrane protein VMA21 n=1 Tax=Penicillium capsulatum TaxID=69766 RepID=A0A9W9LKH8_9EURO|nr:hypothetical protein N7492_006557 [Penicillium capsulatum]KAJ6116392.1 hypothetical protein N7512_006117 [Penicillium capsulatum]
MSARRPQGQGNADVTAKPAQEKGASDVTPAVPADVIYKLLAFTAAMVVAPIGMYFLTVNAIFGGEILYPMADLHCRSSTIVDSVDYSNTVLGNTTWAGITAALTANLVLFAYIYVAWKEDQGDREAEKSKKAQ